MHEHVLCWALCQALQTCLWHLTRAQLQGAGAETVILCCELWVCAASCAGAVGRLLTKHTPPPRGRERSPEPGQVT